MAKIKHEGLHTYRLRDNPLEQKFAKAWAADNKRSAGCDLLDYLLAVDPNYPKGEVSQRDATVAATIIQWLGTPVGQSFLHQVMGKGE